MFTGIVAAACRVTSAHFDSTHGQIAVELPSDLRDGLELGASVSVDGVCLTVSALEGSVATFDIIKGTIDRTSLSSAAPGLHVNIERSVTVGSEVGGHEVSGHVDTCATVDKIEHMPGSVCMTFGVPERWMRYLFPHGFVAINGASLTVSDLYKDTSQFTVWLIPETLRRTNLGMCKQGSIVNVEIHRGVQVVVDTMTTAIENFLERSLSRGGDAAQLMDQLQKLLPELPGAAKLLGGGNARESK